MLALGDLRESLPRVGALERFLDLRHRCHKLRAVIPDYAKSAGTMLALGADEIVMAPTSELGPLDAQIEHPDREGLTVSALDVAGALGFLGDYANEYIMEGGRNLVMSTELPREVVLREMARFVAAFLRPAVTKLDPHMIHRAANQLDIAHKYAEIMLNERRLSEEDSHREFDPKTFVGHLVRDYPAHGFVISRKEARSLRLPVRDIESYDKCEEVLHSFRMFQEGLSTGAGPGSIIRVMDQSELERFFEQEDAETGNEATNDNEDGNENQPEENQGAEDGSASPPSDA